MAQPESHFIIVHVLEGHFGILPPSLKQAGNKKVGIYVECSLKSAIQQTEPVNSSSPVWNHRFIWQLTPRTLLQFKTDRVPLKLQFQLQDIHTKSPLGHLVLNLRDGETNEKEKTYSLLHSKEKPPPQVTLLFRVCKKSEWDEEQKEKEKRELHLRELKKKMGQRSPPNQILAIASTKLANTKNRIEKPKVQKQETKAIPFLEMKSPNTSYEDEFEQESQSLKASKTPIKAQRIEHDEEEEHEDNNFKQPPIETKPPAKTKEKEKEISKKKNQKEDSSSSESEDESDSESSSESEFEASHKKGKKKTKYLIPVQTQTSNTTVPPIIPPEVSPPKQEQAPKKEVTVNFVNEEELERLWRVSVDVRSVKDFVFPAENLYFQYSYPIFGSDEPVYTQPISVAATLEAFDLNEESTEFPVRNSFCTFQFPFKAKALYSYLESSPLVLDVMDKTRNAYDNRIGIVSVDFMNLLTAPKQANYNTILQISDAWTSISALEDISLRIGLVRVILTLEDCGVVSPPPQPTTSIETGKIAIPTPEMIEEIGKWKKEEKEKWRLKSKEREQTVKAKWDIELKKKRDEQEALFAKRTSEIIQLQERLRATLIDLERRDQKLSSLEEEHKKKSLHLQLEYERKLSQVEDATKRLQHDLAHQKELEQMKTQELEKQKKDLERRLKEAEVKVKEIDKEFEGYKQKIHNQPEMRLQSEIISLTGQKAELTQQFEASQRKLKQLKIKNQKLQEENEKLQKERLNYEQERLHKEHQELDNIRQRYIAKEQSDLSKSEKQELEQLKLELKTLKIKEELNAMATSQTQKQLPNGGYPIVAWNENSNNPYTETFSQRPPLRDYTNISSNVENERLERLLKEKESLMNTGLYSEDSRIIRELNLEIEAAKNPLQNTNKAKR